MKKLLVFLISALALTNSFAQNVAINADASLPNSSAMLDVKSTNKGMLIPRVALTGTADITTIPSPATSLMIYNTTAAGSGTTAVVPGYYYWDGTWVRMVAQKGGAVPFADFYETISQGFGAGQPMQFSQDAIPNSIITRLSPSSFNLPDIATYEITFLATISGSVQLAISLNGIVVASSVVGRTATNSQVLGTSLITTTAVNSSLSIVNNNVPFSASVSTPGNISAHLIIKKLN